MTGIYTDIFSPPFEEMRFKFSSSAVDYYVTQSSILNLHVCPAAQLARTVR